MVYRGLNETPTTLGATMPKFELIENKKPHHLMIDDNIIHEDKFWRVAGNYSVLGYPDHTRRMLMIAPWQLVNSRGFKFLEITTEHRIDAYRRTD
jgi:hypothetical protein